MAGLVENIKEQPEWSWAKPMQGGMQAASADVIAAMTPFTKDVIALDVSEAKAKYKEDTLNKHSTEMTIVEEKLNKLAKECRLLKNMHKSRAE